MKSMNRIKLPKKKIFDVKFIIAIKNIIFFKLEDLNAVGIINNK